MLLLTVVGPHGRADVAAPADTPVAELLHAFADLTAGDARALAGWEIAPSGSAPLPAESTLAEGGVVDGAILQLRPAGESQAEPAAARPRLDGGGDERGPLQRTRDVLPAWTARVSRIVPALRATRRRGPDADMGRIERARASWASADYEPRLNAEIRAPRLRRSVTIAVAATAPGAGASTVTALLATLFAHVSRERAVVADLARDGAAPDRAPARGAVQLLDCGTELGHEAIGRADQLVLVCDAANTTATHVAQAAVALGAGAPPVVAVANMLARRARALDPQRLERALPDARGVVGLHAAPRLAARVADGSFAWSEKAGPWDVEVRELALLLAADWERLGLAAAPLRSPG